MKKIIFLAAILLATAFEMPAQPGPMSDSGAALIKFFGDNNSFSATCELKMTNPAGAEIMSGTMTYAMLVDKVRTEVDMARMKSSQLPAGAIDSLKKMNMADIASIVRPDQKMIYLIYPGLKSYVKMPVPMPDASTNKNIKIVKTKIGDETVDGHPCVKNKAVVTDDNGQTHEAILWNATDMKDFPLQIQSTEQGMTALMHFKNINFTKPDSSLFDPPAGFTVYPDMQQLMMTVMQKSTPPAPAPTPTP